MSAPWDLASECWQDSRSPGSCDFPQPERLGLRKVTSRKWLHFESTQITTQFKKKQFWPWERCVIWDSPEVTPTPLISETLGKAGRLSSASGPNIQVFPKHFWFRDSMALQTQPCPSLYHLSPVMPQLSLTHPHSCLANWSGCLCPCKIHMLKPILGHSLSLMSDGL